MKPEYKVREGEKPLLHKHIYTLTLRGQEHQRIRSDPTLEVEERKCADTFNGAMKGLWMRILKRNLQCANQEKLDMMNKDSKQQQRPKLKKQFARIDKVTIPCKLQDHHSLWNFFVMIYAYSIKTTVLI